MTPKQMEGVAAERRINEIKARALAEEDMRLFGTGFYRQNADGSFEHIPPCEVFIAAPKKTWWQRFRKWIGF